MHSIRIARLPFVNRVRSGLLDFSSYFEVYIPKTLTVLHCLVNGNGAQRSSTEMRVRSANFVRQCSLFRAKNTRDLILVYHYLGWFG